MSFNLNAEQQAIVDNANRIAAEAAVSGHPPSDEFVNRCNSEAGVSPERYVYSLEDPPEYVISNATSMQPTVGAMDSESFAKILERPIAQLAIGDRMRPRIIVIDESKEYPPNRTVVEHLRRYYDVKVLEDTEIAGAIRGEQRIEVYDKGEKDMALGWFVKLKDCGTYQWNNIYGAQPTGKAFTTEMLLNTGYQDF